MRLPSKSPPAYGSRGRLHGADRGIRRVAPTFGKEKHLTHSGKGGDQLAVEGNAERVTSHILTLDPRVAGFKPQPFTVDLIDKCIHRTPEALAKAKARHRSRQGPWFYTPDFGVDWHSDTRALIEVKLQGFEGNEPYRQKLQLACEILEASGYRFIRVVIPANPRHPLKNNVQLLCTAALRRHLWPTSEQATAIMAQCGPTGVTLGALCLGLQASPSLVPVWIARGVLRADIGQHSINSALMLFPAYGDLSHLELLGVVTI